MCYKSFGGRFLNTLRSLNRLVQQSSISFEYVLVSRGEAHQTQAMCNVDLGLEFYTACDVLSGNKTSWFIARKLRSFLLHIAQQTCGSQGKEVLTCLERCEPNILLLGPLFFKAHPLRRHSKTTVDWSIIFTCTYETSQG